MQKIYVLIATKQGDAGLSGISISDEPVAATLSKGLADQWVKTNSSNRSYVALEVIDQIKE